MGTASEDILARAAKYNRIEFHPDELGRLIGVKQLKLSEQLKIQEMAPGLEGSTLTEGEDGKMIELPKTLPLIMAASVRKIDDQDIPFPRDRRSLDAILDRLDSEGLAAAGAALGKFMPKKAKVEGDESEGDEAEEASTDPK
jgi:hypothetical protein